MKLQHKDLKQMKPGKAKNKEGQKAGTFLKEEVEKMRQSKSACSGELRVQAGWQYSGKTSDNKGL